MPLDSHNATEQMIETQIRQRGIHDPALEQALFRFPREQFVPVSLQPRAYEDGPLPIGEGQTISQPYIVALMTHLLKLNGSERVLEIGTGCGYQTVILAALCAEVHSVEIVPELFKKANLRLRGIKDIAVQRIHLYLRNGREGVPEAAPFDRILCAAATEDVPPAWKEQLRPGGRMVLPVGKNAQDLVVITKSADEVPEYAKEVVIPVRFVPLI